MTCPCLIAGEPSDSGGMVNVHIPHSLRVNGYCFCSQLSIEENPMDKNEIVFFWNTN